jgi:hypothetical protein
MFRLLEFSNVTFHSDELAMINGTNKEHKKLIKTFDSSTPIKVCQERLDELNKNQDESKTIFDTHQTQKILVVFLF